MKTENDKLLKRIEWYIEGALEDYQAGELTEDEDVSKIARQLLKEIEAHYSKSNQESNGGTRTE